MTARPSLVFLPGFDGAAELRRPFLDALAPRFGVQGISYPNQPFATLNGYGRFAAAQLGPDARPVLVAESFSGLVAARWASRDPHVAALVLCGAFARNPLAFFTSLGASLPAMVQMGAGLLGPMTAPRSDPRRRQWAADLSRTLRALDPAVVAERMRLIAEEDVSAEIAALSIPVLLVQFEGDAVVGPGARRELERLRPAAEVLRIDGPHFAIETRPEDCAREIAMRLGALL